MQAPCRSLSGRLAALLFGLCSAGTGLVAAPADIVGPIADTAASAANGPVPPPQVRPWLARIHAAASQGNFAGTLVVSTAGGPVSSARITHFYDGGNQFERIEPLDGEARHVLRFNETVHTVWPRSRVALVEQRDVLNAFPSLLQTGGDHVAEFYTLRTTGTGRVAGHEAAVLTLQPRDAYRFGYRLWAEMATGLLLRADVLGERGELLETSAFSELRMGVKPERGQVVQPMKNREGYRVLRAVFQPARLEAEGWAMRSPVPGFQQVRCVKRPMESAVFTDTASTAAAPDVLQTVFSDGLTSVSVFIEPQRSGREMQETSSAKGAMHMVRMRRGEYWVTVVGDVPLATLKVFSSHLEKVK